MTVGTVIYAAPEQLTDAPVDGRADQYSLAATAYHLLTGAPPFAHTNPAVVIGQHLTASPPKLSDKHGQLADLDAPFATALSKNPRDRYESCRDFAAALAGKKVKQPASRSTVHTAVAMSRRAPVAVAPPPVAEVRSAPPPKRVHLRPSIVVSIAAALAIVAVAATYALTRDTDADQPSNIPSTSYGGATRIDSIDKAATGRSPTLGTGDRDVVPAGPMERNVSVARGHDGPMLFAPTTAPTPGRPTAASNWTPLSSRPSAMTRAPSSTKHLRASRPRAQSQALRRMRRALWSRTGSGRCRIGLPMATMTLQSVRAGPAGGTDTTPMAVSPTPATSREAPTSPTPS